jgi:outer membrane protein
LDQTTQRFNVGLVAITDVQNARSQYDAVLANEVTARNNLDNAVEALRQVTGNYYPELASLNVDGFKTNKPQAVNALLKEAENRNLSLLQARLSQDLAREQIRQAQDGHLPTLNLTASTGYRIPPTAVQKPNPPSMTTAMPGRTNRPELLPAAVSGRDGELAGETGAVQLCWRQRAAGKRAPQRGADRAFLL